MAGRLRAAVSGSGPEEVVGRIRLAETVREQWEAGWAYFPYRNPGIFTIPLSFLTGIVVSLVAPEPAAQLGFARLEHQIHVGEEEPV